jgi:uncharacterized membrane protein YkvA (DUF1232 family)
MEKENANQPKRPISTRTKVLRIIAIVLLIASIAYVIIPLDFDKKGILGYFDDFFVFMAAFTFLRGSFTPPERPYIKRQLYSISLTCIVLGIVWILVLLLKS